jgi:hypothetical protein
VVLPALGVPYSAIPAAAADETAQAMGVESQNYWEHTGQAESEESPLSWFVAGTLPNWQGTPLVVVVLLEESNEDLARQIGRELLVDAMSP